MQLLSRSSPLLHIQSPKRTYKIHWGFIWLRVLPLSFLILIALIPTQIYFTEDKFDLLPLLALFLFLPRPILLLRTMTAAVGAVHDEMRENRWDVLILTGIPARKIVWTKYLQVVRQTAFDHFVFGLLHIGSAVAVSEFLNAWSYNYKGMIFAPYDYYAGTFSNLPLYPSVTTFVIGLCVVGLFGLLECALAASIGLTAGFTSKKVSICATLVSSTYFVGLFIIIFVIWFQLQLGNRWGNERTIYCYPISLDCNTSLIRIYTKVADTLGLALFVPIDQGTMLAANLMRPYDTRVTDVEWYDSFGNMSYYSMNYDNRPFVLRNVVAALLGAGIYALLIRAFLRRATRFAIINHGASGYLEL